VLERGVALDLLALHRRISERSQYRSTWARWSFWRRTCLLM
jgi:hypothetical protein